jgi:hypothetical protein
VNAGSARTARLAPRQGNGAGDGDGLGFPFGAFVGFGVGVGLAVGFAVGVGVGAGVAVGAGVGSVEGGGSVGHAPDAGSHDALGEGDGGAAGHVRVGANLAPHVWPNGKNPLP